LYGQKLFFPNSKKEYGLVPVFFTGLLGGFRAVRLRRLHFLRGVRRATAPTGGAGSH